MSVDAFNKASWLWVDEDVDGRNIYAKLGSFGDKNIVVGLYGSDCDIETSRQMEETAQRKSELRRIVTRRQYGIIEDNQLYVLSVDGMIAAPS
jgi:hypothetical protein